MAVYRPWGNVLWLLEKLHIDDWTVLGCVATESRSCQSAVNIRQFCSSYLMLRILDPQPLQTDDVSKAYDKSEGLLAPIANNNIEIVSSELIVPLDDLEDYVEKCVLKGPNIILDITSFPKRWFFPLVQMIVSDERVQNFVAVYTQGENYALNIAENPEMLRPLPGFPTTEGRSKHEHAFIGVGFHDLGMLKLLGDDRVKTLNLLFPFPPGPPGIKKNWKFVEQIKRKIGAGISVDDPSQPFSLQFLPALDVSEAFTAMVGITRNGELSSIMAPYGPKPTSLAMCLFSIAAELTSKPEVPVYYSQPQRYAIDYTKNASFTDEKLNSWGYAIKLNGKSLYSME